MGDNRVQKVGDFGLDETGMLHVDLIHRDYSGRRVIFDAFIVVVIIFCTFLFVAGLLILALCDPLFFFH